MRNLAQRGLCFSQPKQGDAALADANGRFGFFIQGGAFARQGLLRPTDGSLRLSNSQQKIIKTLRLVSKTGCLCLVLNAGKVKKGPKVAVNAAGECVCPEQSRAFRFDN